VAHPPTHSEPWHRDERYCQLLSCQCQLPPGALPPPWDAAVTAACSSGRRWALTVDRALRTVRHGPWRKLMRHRTLSALGAAALAAVVGLVALLPPASAAPAAGGYAAASPEYGMSVFVYGNAGSTSRDLGKLQALGFGWQKSLFPWRDI